jgi:PKD repeat protein
MALRFAALASLALCAAFTLHGCGGGDSGTTPTTDTPATSTPVASVTAFTVSSLSPTANALVQFTDTSTPQPIAWNWDFGDGSHSDQQHPAHVYANAGTYTVVLTATSASGGGSSASQTLNVNAEAGKVAFSMAQTLSDGAQRTTLAFSGLAMMTGNLAAQSFFPPGKVADYTGFQYLRDNDPDNMGHNTSFLTRVANNVIFILNDAQFAQLRTLATAQLEQINLYGYKRYPLMQAFRRLIDGNIPNGASGLNLNAVKKASRELYLIDGQISYDRALLYGAIIRSLDATQRAYLDAMKGKGWNAWPNVTDAQVRGKMQGLPQGTAVAVMTYASDLFSWYAGSLQADVYFCPERHGTYYGAFYIKDAPAVGHEGYSIDEQLTATAGAALSDSSKGYVTPAQASLMSSLVATQRDNLHAIVALRTQIATLLRGLIAANAPTESIKARVLALSATYGELDGANNHAYASVFAQVHGSLGGDQKSRLAALRKSIMSGTYGDGTPFDYSVATTPFLYAQAISDTSVLAPYIANTDYLFQEP